MKCDKHFFIQMLRLELAKLMQSILVDIYHTVINERDVLHRWITYCVYTIFTFNFINLAHADVLHWSGWRPWSVCTVSCGTGQELRTRKCLYKGQLNDRSCDGPDQAIRKCNREPCAGKHIDWVIFKYQVLI